MRVAFIGAGTHLVSVLDSISDNIQVVGVFDNLLKEESFQGIKKLGKLEDFVNCRNQFDAVMVTIGDIMMRESLLDLVKQSGIPCISIIDKSAIVSSLAVIEEGCFVGKGVIVNAQAKIGHSCILNSGCIVEHGCELGTNVHVAPGAILCGNVHVGNHVLIGAGTTVIQSLEICSHAYVGAGACVCKTIEHAGVYVGIPAKGDELMHTFIIAEAGVNHNGSLEVAKQLIDAAAQAKADAVKFQTFKASKLVSVGAPKAEYQKETTDAKESQLEMIAKLQLSEADHYELLDYAKQKGILFLSSAFDEESLEFLENLGMPLYKIPSGEITNLPLLKQVGSYHKDVILSCGMSTLEEIQCAYTTLLASGAKSVSILHCNTQYPTPYEDVNLRSMDYLAEHFDCPIGFSDHTLGIEIPLAAVARGAKIIEKHFTLDRNMEGPDHKASLIPSELAAMVSGIRHIEVALGEKNKVVTPSESQNRLIARKSLVASCAIQAGETFTKDNLTLKRPGTGIGANHYEELLGCVAKFDYAADTLIRFEEMEK